MAKKNVFVSFDYEHDLHYKNLLKAWDANDDFDFTFNDTSPSSAVDSEDAGPIKRALSRMIGDSTHLLCIIGKETHKSEWVEWEINKAKELGKKLVGVKIDMENESPSEILNAGAAWAMSFTLDAIVKALNDA